MIDFVIAQSGHKVGYMSTNAKCPIYGYKYLGDIKNAILDIRENYPEHTYTFEGIVPNGDECAREFTDKDSIFKNKILTRLESVSKPRTYQELKQWER